MLMSEGVRTSMGSYADPSLVLVTGRKVLVLTVLILGTISMFVNTVLRNLFMDPLRAHWTQAKTS